MKQSHRFIVLLAVDFPVVAFTPKGGCPLKRDGKKIKFFVREDGVAFTPKGGCPLKP